MNISNYYWYFKSAIPPRICDMIVKYGQAEKNREIMAITGGYGRDRDLNKQPLSKEEIKDLQKKRDSNIVWMNDRWIYKEIQPYVKMANQNAGWNFNWDWSQSCQFTIYKKGQYYDWHCDGWDKPYQRKKGDPDNGKVRKLSMTCQLTDGSEYTGGELEFDFRNYDPHLRDESKHIRQVKEILPKGSIVVFPSHLWHRVKPVTRGTRYSLVVWHLGDPFK